MAKCKMCGSSIPEEQNNICSMCYGDSEYGRDGYYKAELERNMNEREDCNE